MSRTARLFKLMDALRGHRRPVTAARLAGELDVSVRTVYRDIQTLTDLGAPIGGEAGVGYLLRSGFFLPPLMFGEDELEALVLGARWVQGQGDPSLAQAAVTALVKIGTAAVPECIRATHRAANDTRGPASRAQADHHLCGQGGCSHRKGRLAHRAGLLRRQAPAGGMVRVTQRLSPLSLGSDRRDQFHSHALSHAACRPGENVAPRAQPPSGPLTLTEGS
jgi:biotin operon repressor